VTVQRKLNPLLAFKALAMAAALALSACSGGAGDSAKGRDKGPPAVSYVVVQPSSVAMVQSLPARVSAFEVSDVRPQVSGIIQKRDFTEGSFVRKGQTLYQIDPSQYQAAVAQAEANVRSARAAADSARALAARYKPLVQMEAVSKQDYTNAVSQAQQAEAAIAQNQAALRAAQINVRFTRVPAPISGRIGISNVTEGALVTANQTDALTTITRLDPVNVDIQESAADLIALRRAMSTGGVAPSSAQVRLTLPDGSDYGFTGTVQFSEVIVDQSTGTVTLRARFANPAQILLPGLFVTATFSQAVDTSAFLVPQQAISRDPKGNATLFVVGPGNKAVQRTVVTSRTQGPYWVVTQGLAAGEKVITEGAGNLHDGDTVRPSPAKAAGTPKASPAASVKAQTGGKTD
jgi:membrane fusion protein (multidrug efflux system)